jgi:hypothetical protein
VVAHKPLVATAPDEAALAERVRDVRARVAFYISTPAYRAAFAHHGLGDLADELAQLSRAQRWEEMPGRISDDVLGTYATIGTWDEIGERLRARFGSVVTSIEFSIAVRTPADADAMAGLIRQLSGGE